MHLLEGAFLQNGKYQIEKVLGQGGFGITYLARQEILEREVCIKEFFMRDFCNRSETNSAVTLGTSANKELIERYLNKFIKEARTIAALDHPNIIHIHDIFKENDTAYYVMDYIEGESLSEMVRRRGALLEEEAVKYIRSVADALKYVHQRSINHLDVKPGNIMVRHSDSHVFLLDFGLSKQYDTAGNQTSSTPLGISHGFAPIEQYSPEGIKEFSPQTDIYSLGATLYYLVTGTTPPPASELFTSELEGFPATTSVSVKEAIKKAMKPQKKERPQNIDEFLSLLSKESIRKPQTAQVAIEVYEKEETVLQQKNNSTQSSSQKQIKEDSRNNKTKWINSNKVAIGWTLGIILIAIVFFLPINKSENADDLYQKGEQAFHDKNYPTAISSFEKAAEQGHAGAQYYLGYMYQYGQGVSQDYTKAMEWYRKAAEQGDAAAQCNLGYMYGNGQGVTQNYSEAVIWFQKAAEQGNSGAQYNLGVMYQDGIGVSQDYTKAMELYRKAAEQGDAAAQCNLGYMYKNGQGVSKDYAKAMEWFRKAAEQGNAGGQWNLGVMYQDGIGVSQDYTKAMELYRKAAEQGDAAAQCNLGYMYKNGQGVSKDYAKAMEWFRKAAEQGDATAQCNLGVMYQYGQGVSQDYTKAVEWYRKAAEQGNVIGQYNLGYMYELGKGITKDKAEAIKWYKKAAAQGDEDAKAKVNWLTK